MGNESKRIYTELDEFLLAQVEKYCLEQVWSCSFSDVVRLAVEYVASNDLPLSPGLYRNASVGIPKQARFDKNLQHTLKQLMHKYDMKGAAVIRVAIYAFMSKVRAEDLEANDAQQELELSGRG